MVFMVCVGMLLCIAVAFTCLVGRRIEDKALYRICYDKAGGIYMELYREY